MKRVKDTDCFISCISSEDLTVLSSMDPSESLSVRKITSGTRKPSVFTDHVGYAVRILFSSVLNNIIFCLGY